MNLAVFILILIPVSKSILFSRHYSSVSTHFQDSRCIWILVLNLFIRPGLCFLYCFSASAVTGPVSHIFHVICSMWPFKPHQLPFLSPENFSPPSKLLPPLQATFIERSEEIRNYPRLPDCLFETWLPSLIRCFVFNVATPLGISTLQLITMLFARACRTPASL